MARIVVAGTENASVMDPTTVAVVDASDPANPSVQMLAPHIGQTGARVDVDGGLLAVGAELPGVTGAAVALFDVTKPSAPTSKGNVTTPLTGGIGALAVHGKLVAVGELSSPSGGRVALIDASGATPSVVSEATTPLIGVTIQKDDMLMGLGAVTSVAFLSDTLVIAAGPTSGQIILIDFSNRASPVVTPINTTFASIGSADADSNAQRIVAGDGFGSQFGLFDSGASVLSTQTATLLAGITSVSVSMPLAIAGSTNTEDVALIDFSAPNVTQFFAGLTGGGATAKIKGKFIALGSLAGPFGPSLGRLQFFDAASTAMPLGHADVNLASISTVGIAETVDVTASSSLLDFGSVVVLATAARSVTFKNTGSIARRLTAAAIIGRTGSGTFVIAAPSAFTTITLAANGGSATINVTFTGGATTGASSATLSLTTDDPAATNIRVSLTGRVRRDFSGYILRLWKLLFPSHRFPLLPG
ncbi:hypothetical protein AYJ54_02895 [Bradyrhizobium centrolobii]|uniref:Abnormal spindle-like microcephaly-associated protein ASH domain-containing protein n=1 Tax=Bradyrhizobium centrolobii TaxID=1505087 RepID=A0A176YIX9_9BRAD|nr:hypothetical protein [Bradyrhizobium centrolobii]OAF05845.1 hypothetical protein AYJ54_02895 [Bradyrhizobium centrolobii]